MEQLCNGAALQKHKHIVFTNLLTVSILLWDSQARCLGSLTKPDSRGLEIQPRWFSLRACTAPGD